MNAYKPRVLAPDPKKISKISDVLKKYTLTSVCEKAACMNRNECYANKSTTFMILGDICTRSCRFCNIKTGRPKEIDLNEPHRIALAVKELELKYVVITSVDRDDLKDFGAKQFVRCVQEIKKLCEDTKVELLTPDFKAKSDLLQIIIDSNADKLSHNQESTRSISKILRPQSDYDRSLQTLRYYAKNSNIPVKSSLMVGLGENEKDLIQTFKDLKNAGVSHLTLGQYLQPSPKHHPVVKYFSRDFFERLKDIALDMGFKSVISGSLVRSSYFAHLY